MQRLDAKQDGNEARALLAELQSFPGTSSKKLPPPAGFVGKLGPFPAIPAT
ncbi:hypothetical protein [Mesorhizobium sp. STM 4661]|uniref:hypothetical protein n=1 Tax=Mesorhizobium sp. STM 4661 TaxID=1297570 RepID=UPI0012F7F72A|nr:hypothetical protein [Mesorhizobium sp. STM 4661]